METSREAFRKAEGVALLPPPTHARLAGETCKKLYLFTRWDFGLDGISTERSGDAVQMFILLVSCRDLQTLVCGPNAVHGEPLPTASLSMKFAKTLALTYWCLLHSTRCALAVCRGYSERQEGGVKTPCLSECLQKIDKEDPKKIFPGSDVFR